MTDRGKPYAERVDELVQWARSRIAQCRKEEDKFSRRARIGKYATGDVVICASTERRALQERRQHDDR